MLCCCHPSHVVIPVLQTSCSMVSYHQHCRGTSMLWQLEHADELDAHGGPQTL